MQQAADTMTMCPVCTLYLRPGITLKQHLASHPKQKVIDALVKLSLFDDGSKPQSSQQPNHESLTEALQPNQPPLAPYVSQVAVGHPSNVGNHFFMYQQSMSTSTPHQASIASMPFSPFGQQYLVPAVYNPQMMPYFYQQQQLIMSSNGLPPHVRALSFDLANPGQLNGAAGNRPSDLSINEEKEKELEKEEPANKEGEKQGEDEEVLVLNDPESEQSDSKIPAKSSEDDSLDEEESHDLPYKSEQDRTESGNYSHNENSSDHNYESHDVDSHYHHQGNSIDHEECVDGVGTPTSDWSGFHPDLNKACQTQVGANLSPRSGSQHEEQTAVLPEARSNYFYIDQRSNMSGVYTSEEQQSYEQSEPIYTSANIINNTEGLEFMSLDEIDGMQVIIGEFSNSSMIPPPENYEPVRENSPILMTINGMSGNVEMLEHNVLSNSVEDSCIENVNIRSDEKMPPRGELSGQESMGSSSDITWNHLQHYQEPAGASYEHNSWDSTEEIHTYVEHDDKKENISTVDVAVLKEGTSSGAKLTPRAIIGLDINRKKIKKLVIKPKKPKRETQTNFDNLFTGRLKQERAEEEVDNSGLDNKDEIKVENKPPIINACKCCDKLFKTKKDLRQHNKEFHKLQRTKAIKCQICDEAFDMEHKFNEHLKVHPLECRMCGKLFFRRQGLKLHTARHLGIKPFKCDLCDKAFLVKQKLEEHRNCHTGNSPIKCSMCPESFKRHSNLVQHRNKHHFMIKRKVKDYICFCGEVFHSKKKLAWHKEIHDSKPKACTQCSEKFIHMASLTRHMRRAHNAEYLPDDRNPAVSNAECPVCKGIYLKTSLDAHLKTHTSQKPFSCSICNKEFTTKWNLKLHKWTHASRTQKPFKCELCRGAFIRENDYISHMNSHKSLRPYTCNYCGAQFIRKYNCQRHVKEHENDKTYNCNVCGKSFHRSYYLKDHMRVHSGDRPYSCHICGKTSTTKSNHNKHVQIHHAREPVSTEN